MLKPESKFLLTGAASGIGAATLALLTREGHRVAAADVNADALRDRCEAAGERAIPIALDVRDPAQWERALDEAWDRLGGLDVLINNAGLAHTGYSHELPIEKLRHMIEVNQIGLAQGTCAVVPRFLQHAFSHWWVFLFCVV